METRLQRLVQLGVEEALVEAVNIDPLQLNDEYVTWPGNFAYWNERYASAYCAERVAKVALAKVRAEQDRAWRAYFEAERAKVTEAVVAAAVNTDEKVIAAELDYAMKDAERVRMRGVVMALEGKKDMLVSMGAHVRAEMAHDPTIRAEQRNYRNVQNEGLTISGDV